MKRIGLVLALSALVMAIVMSGSAVAQIPDKAGCPEINTADYRQAVIPTYQDNFHSPRSDMQKDRC